MTPATPNAEDTLRRSAALLEEVVVVLFELAEVAVPVDPELPVEEALEPPLPVSLTLELRQVEEDPAVIVTISEY